MTTQPPLWPPIARKTDPATSKRAAADQELGPRHTNMRRVLEVIGTWPDLTAREAAARAGVDGGWKRVSDLHAKGLVEISGQRACKMTGKLARTWRRREK